MDRYKIIRITFLNQGEPGYRDGVLPNEQYIEEEVPCHNHRTQGGAQRCVSRLYTQTRYAPNITFFRIVRVRMDNNVRSSH